MKKKAFKIIGIVILSVICLYALFIIEEIIRLKNGGESPLIIVGGTCDGDKMHYTSDYETDCKSIGFRIKRRYVLDLKSSDDNLMFNKISEEFWLFDNFLIWGWIS